MREIIGESILGNFTETKKQYDDCKKEVKELQVFFKKNKKAIPPRDTTTFS